jgi:16S rRNA processing protein RimM
MPQERICVAKIGAAHGVRGEVRLFTFTENPLAIRDYGELEDESGTRRFRIVSARAAKGHLVARFEGIDDRNAAEKLTHIELFISRTRLPKQKDAATFYHADLIGLSVETKSGEKLGEVTAVQNFGAGDLLEVRPTGGGMTALIPFVDEYVPVVDVAGGRIVADPPAGLFDGGESSQ